MEKKDLKDFGKQVLVSGVAILFLIGTIKAISFFAPEESQKDIRRRLKSKILIENILEEAQKYDSRTGLSITDKAELVRELGYEKPIDLDKDRIEFGFGYVKPSNSYEFIYYQINDKRHRLFNSEILQYLKSKDLMHLNQMTLIKE